MMDLMQQGACLCEDCHRALWLADGPVCPECATLRMKEVERENEMRPVKSKAKAEKDSETA